MSAHSRTRTRWALAALTAAAAALGTGLATGVLSPTLAGAAGAAAVPVRQDFNGDGYPDLAVGAPGATIGGQANAGYVAVMYGSAHGLSAAHRTVISRATAGIPGAPAARERFGTHTAAADLNGDGYTDLVVNGYEHGSLIVWGGAGGLSGGTAVPGYSSYAQAGDFNGDGKPDLALVDTGTAAGDEPYGSDVVVWNGPVSRGGTPASTGAFDGRSHLFTDVRATASGDVNGDGYADLALAEYTGDGGFGTELYYGGPDGLTGRVVPTSTDIAASVAIGDLNSDGYGDLVVGDPGAQKVTALYGSASGITGTSRRNSVGQNTPGVPGATESGDAFGWSVAVGDVNKDGYQDVAVGVPYEDLGGTRDAGDVIVLRGSANGLTGSKAQAVSQDTKGVPGTAEKGDQFGFAVHLLDVNANGYADLAASAYREDGQNGAVWLLRGRPTGLTADAAFVFGGKTIGAPYQGANFGFTLG
jgi:hypothetical protein